MKVYPDIKIKVLPGVYDPCDDTYLLIKSIDLEGCKDVLDMGCGTGIIALHMVREGCNVVAVDVDDRAIKNTRINAELNGLKLRCIKSDLFEKVDGKFDLIVFNPPYLPTKGENRSWDGGEGGKEIIERFLMDAQKYLKRGGKIYMVMSSLTDTDSVITKFKDVYDFQIIKRDHFFFEDLYVFKITIKS